MEQYINDLFTIFVLPGVFGGLLIGFGAFIISNGFAIGLKMIMSFGSCELED
ncbi:MAG: hypothetical protein ACRC1F_03210 [Metamycoplasmataceae bacterium]